MRVLIYSIIASICLFQRSTLAESSTQVDYKLSGGAIELDDIATEIPGMKVIFNGKGFLVNMGLEWENTGEMRNTSNVLKWSLYVDGALSGSGSQSIGGSRELPKKIVAGTGIVNESGGHNIKVEVSLDDDSITTERHYQSFGSGASLVPLLVVLFLAATTQMVELSLGFGVFVGACMVAGTLKEGFKATLDNYILNALSDVDHGFIYLFALFMSGFVGMVEKSGGLVGFTRLVGRFAKSSRSGQFAGVFTCFTIFFDDYANMLVSGSAMRPIMDSLSISREKLAFIIDGTAAPVASLAPVSSWVGFESGLIQAEIDKIVNLVGEDNLKIPNSGFSVFLQTIQYRYYPIFVLFLMLSLVIFGREWGPMLLAERKVIVYGRTDGGPGGAQKAGGDSEKEVSKNAPSPDTPECSWNMLVPIIMLIFYIFYLLMQTGLAVAPAGAGFLDIMANADSYSALLWGTIGAALTSLLFYMLQYKKDGVLVRPTKETFLPNFITKRLTKKSDTDDNDDNEADKSAPRPLMTPREAMEAFLIGMETIFPALIVLTLAWASGSIMVAVGLDRLFSEMIVGGSLPPGMLPTISFVVSVFIAFATGTSWGTMTIMFPLMMLPAYQAADGEPQIFYGTAAGILAGAVAGDHMSPISDTTVISAMSAGCGLLEHVVTQAPYALSCVLWSLFVGTLPVGLGAYPNGIGILMGLVMTLIVTFGIGVKVINPTGRFDLFTELLLLLKPSEGMNEMRADVVTAFETQQPVLSKDKLFEKEADMEKGEAETEKGGVEMVLPGPPNNAAPEIS
jgi:Na+/H+ antiporter NhaC